MIIGIVGSEQAKFTPRTEAAARDVIRQFLASGKYAGVTSGDCHLGGVDIYAREIAKEMRLPFRGFPPAVHRWEGTAKEPGYHQRNMSIARLADHVICITLRELPPDYLGMRFPLCYHCRTSNHIKSGGCWTVKYAAKIGKIGDVIVID